MKIFVCIFLSIASGFSATTHYVKSGASGTGASWSDAFGNIPAAPVRGDTYYVADGSYSAWTPTTANSGTTYVFIKKATIADHGTSTGWVDTLGDGQAVWPSWFSNTSSAVGYFDIDGQVGDFTASGGITTAYGFKVDFGEGDVGLQFGSSGVTGCGTAWRIQHVDFDGITDTGTHAYTAEGRCINIWPSNADSLYVAHCALHGQDTLVYIESSDNVIFEYNYWTDARSSNPSIHPNVIFIDGGNNGTLRYNFMRNYNAEGIFFTGGGQDGWKIYGNLIYDGVDVARGIELRQDFSYSNIKIVNNTFVNLPLAGIIDRTIETGNTCNGCAATNNLSVNAANSYGNTANSNNTDDSTTSRFVNYSSKNYHLASALAGTASMQSTYNTDFDGNTRGSDGTWDRGAFEFVSGGDVTPPTVSSATINSAGTQITFAMSETVSIGSGGNGGFTLSMSGGAVTATYSSGSGSSSLVYSLSRTVYQGETGTHSYTQPGDGVEDTAGNDLATYSGATVTNSSTQQNTVFGAKLTGNVTLNGSVIIK